MNFACSMCLESLKSNCNVSTTQCGHVFHTNCISRWIENGKDSCPQCRKPCTKDQLIKTFFNLAEIENEKKRDALEADLKGIELAEKRQKLESEVEEWFSGDDQKFFMRGQDILHWCAIKGNMEILLTIINKMEDKNPQDEEGMTPLHFAARYGHEQIYR